MPQVLIVDDREESRYMLRTLLTGNGYEVESACQGSEALEKARRNPPRLIISDLLMPVMDGYTLLRHWKADDRLKAAPFIVYTATFTEPQDEQLALDLGADAFIVKPAEPEQLMARIQELLAKTEAGGRSPVRLPQGTETVLLEEYGEVVVRKLEEKTAELETANRALREDVARSQEAEAWANQLLAQAERARAALRENEERLRLALSAGNQGFYDVDLSTGQTIVSPEYARMLGYEPEEFHESHAAWRGRLHPDDREWVDRFSQEYLAGQRDRYQVEFRQRTKSGDWKWILSSAKVVAWDADGKPLRVLGTHMDITERKRVEEALQESERKLKEAQQMAQLGHWRWDVKSGSVEWSEEVFNIFHLDPNAFSPRIDSIMALSPWPGDQERDKELIRRAVASHEKGTYDQRFLRPDGSTGYYHSTFQGIYDGEGDLISIIGTVLDITDRKRAEAAQTRLLHILESSLNEIYVFDAETFRFEYVNRGALRNLGYTLEAMRRMTPVDLKPEFTEDAFRQEVAPLLRHELEQILFTTVHRRADASLYPVEVHLELVELPGQRVFLAMIQDITERKRSEAVATLLAAIVESSDDAIIGKDLNGIIQTWNRGAERIFGYEASEMIGTSIRKLMPLDQQDEEDRILQKMALGQRVEHFETVRQSKDGRLINVSVTLSPIKDNTGKIIGLSKVARDITERKRAEESLRKQAAELKARNEELERFNRVTTGRELRMIELKREVNDLCQQAGQSPRYALNFTEPLKDTAKREP